MKTTTQITEPTPTLLAASSAHSLPVGPRPVPRYRKREPGVGYGTSSGYASARSYAGDRGQQPLRCR